jgi:DNA processing protein
VDAAAHVGALEAGGTTIAVLGTGIDRVYPAENKDLHERIAANGLLMTEFPPGTQPRMGHFPRRNRIISGLSRGVLIVEAAEKSGSLITARLAADQGRDVMAMPGLTAGGRNRGAHALLRDGAKLVESAVDILQELGMGSASKPATETPETVEFTVDDIASQLKLPAGEALARLLEWELTGEIQRIGSGRFVRSRSKV